jgi:hypothetical protein
VNLTAVFYLSRESCDKNFTKLGAFIFLDQREERDREETQHGF